MFIQFKKLSYDYISYNSTNKSKISVMNAGLLSKRLSKKMYHKRIKFYKELKTSNVSDIDCWMVAFKFRNSSFTYHGPLLDFIFEVSVCQAFYISKSITSHFLRRTKPCTLNFLNVSFKMRKLAEL